MEHVCLQTWSVFLLELAPELGLALRCLGHDVIFIEHDYFFVVEFDYFIYILEKGLLSQDLAMFMIQRWAVETRQRSNAAFRWPIFDHALFRRRTWGYVLFQVGFKCLVWCSLALLVDEEYFATIWLCSFWIFRFLRTGFEARMWASSLELVVFLLVPKRIFINSLKWSRYLYLGLLSSHLLFVGRDVDP